MDTLADRIRQAIRASDGWLGFDCFMQLALYCPGLGYYCGGGAPFASKDGVAGGDFVTAPMLGPWLGRSIWDWSQALRNANPSAQDATNRADTLSVREFGGGRGDLAAALLQAAQQDGQKENQPALKVEMLELSADMQRLQRSRTEGLGAVSFSTSMSPGFKGLVLANEVLDAMPVRCFEWAGGESVLEWGVTEDAASPSGFSWLAKPADALLSAAVLKRKDQAQHRGLPWAKGYRGEHAVWLAPWCQALADSMQSGAALLIDYGYARHELDHPGRTNGTLCAHARHRRIDDRDALLAHPGQQDLTAHVDFGAVACAARDAGFEVLGFVTQARFLMNTGLLEHAQALMEGMPHLVDRARLTQSLQMLMAESEMGEVFKVMLLAKGLDQATSQALFARGFAAGDRRADLA